MINYSMSLIILYSPLIPIYSSNSIILSHITSHLIIHYSSPSLLSPISSNISYPISLSIIILIIVTVIIVLIFIKLRRCKKKINENYIQHNNLKEKDNEIIEVNVDN